MCFALFDRNLEKGCFDRNDVQQNLSFSINDSQI